MCDYVDDYFHELHESMKKRIEELHIALRDERVKLKNDFKHFSKYRKNYERRELFNRLFDLNDIIENSDFLSFDNNYDIFDECVLAKYNLSCSVYDLLRCLETKNFKKGYEFFLRFFIFSVKDGDNIFSQHLRLNFVFSESIRFSYSGMLDYLYKRSEDFLVLPHFPLVIKDFIIERSCNGVLI